MTLLTLPWSRITARDHSRRSGLPADGSLDGVEHLGATRVYQGVIEVDQLPARIGERVLDARRVSS